MGRSQASSPISVCLRPINVGGCFLYGVLRTFLFFRTACLYHLALVPIVLRLTASSWRIPHIAENNFFYLSLRGYGIVFV